MLTLFQGKQRECRVETPADYLKHPSPVDEPANQICLTPAHQETRSSLPVPAVQETRSSLPGPAPQETRSSIPVPAHPETRSSVPIPTDQLSNQSPNSTGDSGHGSSPDTGYGSTHSPDSGHGSSLDSLRGSLPLKSRFVTNNTKKICITPPLPPELDEYPKTRSNLHQKLASCSTDNPANIPMVVRESFLPDNDMVPVRKGMMVNALYQENEWIYVKTAQDMTGFVPVNCLAPIGIKPKLKHFAQQFPNEFDYRTYQSCQSKSAFYVVRPNNTSQSKQGPHKETEGHNNGEISSDSSLISKALKPVKSSTLTDLHHVHSSTFCDQSIKYDASCNNGCTVQCHMKQNKCNRNSNKVHPFTRTIRETARYLLQDYYLKTIDVNNNAANTKQDTSSDTSCIRWCPSNSPIKEESPEDIVLLAESRRQKAKDIYFAHDISSVGYFDSEVKSLHTSPILNLSFASERSDVSSVFTKSEGPQLTVLFDYIAQDENDVTVHNHDVVTLLNNEDTDWIYVRTERGKEGFIPSMYAVNLGALNLEPNARTTYL